MLTYFLIANLYAQNDEPSEEDKQSAKNFRGFLDTTFEVLQITTLEDGIQSNIGMGGISGDPQYIWANEDGIGPTMGLRFSLLGNNNINTQAEQYGIGLSFGYQFHKSIRFSGNASYGYSYFFHQEEVARDPSVNQITYRYQEVPSMHALLLEGYVAIRPSAEFSIQPYGVYIKSFDSDARQYKAGVNLSFKGILVGYEYTELENHEIHGFRLGTRVIQ